MSQKIFKALSTLVIFSMLVMAVGTVGVTPAFAAVGLNATAAGITSLADSTPLPYAPGALAYPAALDGPGTCGEVRDAWVYLPALTMDRTLALSLDDVGAPAVIPVVGVYAAPAFGAAPAAGAANLYTGAVLTSCATAVAGGTATLSVLVGAGTAVYVMFGTSTVAVGAETMLAGITSPEAWATVGNLPPFVAAAPDITRGTLTVGGGILPDDGADADPYNDSYYSSAINVPASNVAEPDNPIGCYIGTYTGWVRVPLALDPVTGVQLDSTLHINALPGGIDALVIAAYVVNADGTLGARLGCDDSTADGILDLVVQVPAGTVVDVLVANNALFAIPISGLGQLWIQRTGDTSGGLIASGLQLNSRIQIYNPTTAMPPSGSASSPDDAGNAWFGWDVPAGTYNVGVSRQFPATAAPYAYLYTAAVPSRFAYVAPAGATLATLNVPVAWITNIAGVGLASNVDILPSDGRLAQNMRVILGPAGAAIPVLVTPTSWDAAAWIDQAALPDYLLMQRNTLAVVGGTYPLDFRAQIQTPTLVRMCSPNQFDLEQTRFDPPGPLTFITLRYDNGAVVGCPTNYEGGLVFLEAAEAFNIRAELREGTGGDWRYFVVPSNDPWNFTAGVAIPAYTAGFGAWYDMDADGVRDNDGDALYEPPFTDEPTFLTTATTSAEEYLGAVASIAMTRGNWVDADNNRLVSMSSPDNTRVNCLDTNGDGLYNDLGGPFGGGDDNDGGGTSNADGAFGWESRDSISPCDNLTPGMGAEINLANNYTITDLSTVGAIGRYLHTRKIQTGPAAAAVLAMATGDIFAVSPTDTSMLGSWAWSWVEALYELGYTTGIGGGAYGPDQTITRAQMAAFLSRVLADNSTIPAAGAGVGGVFTDVPAGYWAGGAIEQLEDLGITSGCGGGLFCPDAPVTRAEMSKFIQLTFRAATTYGWNCDWNFDGDCTDGFPIEWNPSQNVLAPGSTFIDVPAGHWANLWIEEMFFDNLTSGCTYGVYDPGVRYYCPADDVTRGQMAKFILTALQTNAATQGFWPILAPER